MYAYYFILKVICWQCFIQALIFVLPIVMHIHTPSAAGPATPDEVLVLILCLYTSCRFMALYCLLLVPVCTNLNLHGAPRTPRGHTCCLLLFDKPFLCHYCMSCSFLSVGPCYVSSTINASCLTFHSCPCSVLKILFPSLRVMSLEMILVVPSSTFREIFLLRVRTAPSSCSEVVFFCIFFVYSIHKPYEGRGKTVADIRHAGQTEGCRATEVAVLMRYA